MNIVFKNLIVGLALSSLTLAPLSALAIQGHSNGKGKQKSKHWNPAPPKKNGRHDNRDWNKKRDDDRQWHSSKSSVSQNRSTQSIIDRRQKTKNEWRNLAIASGGIGILGLLTKEPTLTFAGAGGALYSAYRYEQDRKSQSKLNQTRAYYFSQPYFYRDGRRFDRQIVTKNGQRYYQFVRHN